MRSITSSNSCSTPLRRPELIEIRWQAKVTGVTRQPDGVRLDVDTPLGSYALDADWVVACDGGRSTMREALGLSLQGTSYEGRYVIVDIALDSDRPTERLAYFDPSSNPETDGTRPQAARQRVANRLPVAQR